MRAVVISIMVMLCLTNCAPAPKFILKKPAQFETLYITLHASPYVIPEVFNGFQQRLDALIIRHNASADKQFLLEKGRASASGLHITLQGTRLVSSAQQTTGVFVSLLGISLPIALISAGVPFPLYFYYFPTAKSATTFYLSSDIGEDQRAPLNFILASPGFLKSPGKQIDKHIVQFDKLMVGIVHRFNKEYAKKKGTSIEKFSAKGNQ